MCDDRYMFSSIYAEDPKHYIRSFLLIQEDLLEIFKYIEPSEESGDVYSYKIHDLFIRTCIEIEANFKAIFEANKNQIGRKNLNIKHYSKINKTHYLSDFRVFLPIWRENSTFEINPFKEWSDTRNEHKTISWYKDYQKCKHNRHNEFKLANLSNLMSAVAGLLVLITSQFGSKSFSSGSTLLAVEGFDYYDYDSAIGDFFRIAYPKYNEGYAISGDRNKFYDDDFKYIDYDL
jgi:hypothetical protein